MSDGPVLLLKFEGFTASLLERTARFPKILRFTLAARIENRLLDVMEALVDAQYATGRRQQEALGLADAGIARLRILLRLSHLRQCIDSRAYEETARVLDECGRMLGGWVQYASRQTQRGAWDD